MKENSTRYNNQRDSGTDRLCQLDHRCGEIFQRREIQISSKPSLVCKVGRKSNSVELQSRDSRWIESEIEDVRESEELIDRLKKGVAPESDNPTLLEKVMICLSAPGFMPTGESIIMVSSEPQLPERSIALNQLLLINFYPLISSYQHPAGTSFFATLSIRQRRLFAVYEKGVEKCAGLFQI